MNMRAKIGRFDQKLHQFEHKAIFTSEKLMHDERFWVIATVSFILLCLVLLAIFARGGDTSVNRYMGPFGPFYPYGH